MRSPVRLHAGRAVQSLTAAILSAGAVGLLAATFGWVRVMWPRAPFDTFCSGFLLSLLALSIAYVAWRLWRTLLSPPGTRLFPPGLYQFLLHACLPEGHRAVPIDSPHHQMTEVLLLGAIALRADKIVFGEPTDDLPRQNSDPAPEVQPSNEDREFVRSLGVAPLELEPPVVLPWQTKSDLPNNSVPVWFCIRQRWEAQTPLPISLLPQTIQDLEMIMLRGYEQGNPDYTLKFRYVALPSIRVQALLRMECNYCYSVTLRYLDERSHLHLS